MKFDPSPRMQQIVDAVAERGSPAAAAKALGLSVLTVDRSRSSYHQRICGRRTAELEAEIARLHDAADMGRAAQRLERVVGRIERAAMPANHRRLADGGSRVRDQLRTAGANHDPRALPHVPLEANPWESPAARSIPSIVMKAETGASNRALLPTT